MFTNLRLPRCTLTCLPSINMVIVFDEMIGVTGFATNIANTPAAAWVGSIKMAHYFVLMQRGADAVDREAA